MMKGDHKFQTVLGASASTPDRNLSIELPSSRQIYTVGSAVSGLVHLRTKDRDAIQDVHVSLVGVVVSIYYQYYEGSTQDVRREVSKLLNMDETLWSRTEDTRDPPASFSFDFTIPEFGNDAKAKNPQAPLPPSFYPYETTGWRGKLAGKSEMLSDTPMGSVRYYIKVSVARKGIFKRKEKVYYPIVFLPSSPPPPLLPTLPENISVRDLDHLDDSQWSHQIEVSNLHSGIFSSNGYATLTLWLPQVPSFPRLMRIPFIVRLTLQTQRVKDNKAGAEPRKGILPPPPHLDKASLHLKRTLTTHTKGATQEHTKVYDKNATDNFLLGITLQESAWLVKKADVEFYWEKGYMWRGSWTFKETPTFSNRQLTWKYALVAEIPFKGLRNSAKLVSRALEVSSGVTAGTNVVPGSEVDMMDLPPGYFHTEDYDDDLDDSKKA